jgi:hypothetical protein
LYERQGRGSQELLNASEKQRVIAMVCSQPPEGQARWTARLIAEQAVKRKLVPRVGRETMRVLLTSHDLKPWREKNVVHRRPGRRIRPQYGRSPIVPPSRWFAGTKNLSLSTRICEHPSRRIRAKSPNAITNTNVAEPPMSFRPAVSRKRRIPSLVLLQREAHAWNRKINRDKTTIDWRFSGNKARQKFGYDKNSFMRS